MCTAWSRRSTHRNQTNRSGNWSKNVRVKHQLWILRISRHQRYQALSASPTSTSKACTKTLVLRTKSRPALPHSRKRRSRRANWLHHDSNHNSSWGKIWSRSTKSLSTTRSLPYKPSDCRTKVQRRWKTMNQARNHLQCNWQHQDRRQKRGTYSKWIKMSKLSRQEAKTSSLRTFKTSSQRRQRSHKKIIVPLPRVSVARQKIGKVKVSYCECPTSKAFLGTKSPRKNLGTPVNHQYTDERLLK